ncbi:MAG: 23S rRNA (adenine(2503)-C(2))-methyltransferase RlmN [Acidimicrobiaceae bacterium]|nr:23S rRNA (adenine(2503)-C(2))-methyltransferase RlmN [Acidimicrobiaceae bacterium]
MYFAPECSTTRILHKSTSNKVSTKIAVGRYDASREDIAAIVGDGPKYRIDQIWQGMYREFLEPLEITTISKELRTRIDTALPNSLVPVTSSDSDRGDTTKFLWQLSNGGHRIESVLMHYAERATVCVSTQAGCAMGCGFCATGQAGFTRQLTSGEIVEQVVRAARTSAQRKQRLANVVFMGMGEPLANEEAVWQAVTRIHEAIGLSARHLTISTVGIIPGINTLADRPLPVNLAVSLHAARNELRNELVPINKRYPIEDLMQACRKYLAKKNRRISFEWALIQGVNDTQRDARELAKLCKSLKPSAHVNLIPLNPTPGYSTKGTLPADVREFAMQLEDLGVNATVRRNRGTDIDAACGQLAAGQPVTLTSRSVIP